MLEKRSRLSLRTSRITKQQKEKEKEFNTIAIHCSTRQYQRTLLK